MADTNTNNTPANTEKNPHDQWFTVKYGGRNEQFKYMSVADLLSDADLNIRYTAGQEVYGVKVETDTYDLPDMMSKIDGMGGIQMPILASLRQDHTLRVLHGNRRTRAGQLMLADPNLRPELRKALTEQTPVRILKGLTVEQEMELIADQEQKAFKRSEALRHIWKQVQAGKSYGAIIAHNEVMARKFVNNPKKQAEVDEEVRNMTTTERQKRLQGWFRGSIDEYVIAAYKLGAYVRKQTLLSELRLDGDLKPSSEQPFFLTTKNSQKRMAALEAAAKKDGSKHNAFVPVEGSEFKKMLDQFHQEDYGPTVTKEKKETGPKMLKQSDVEGLQGTFQSRVAKLVVDRILGKAVPDLIPADDFAAIQEAKMLLLTDMLPSLRPEVAAVLRLAFVNPDPEEFSKYLSANTIQDDGNDTGDTEGADGGDRPEPEEAAEGGGAGE